MAEVKDPMRDSDERTSREIRDDIRRTRARMDATVDAIEDKLTPGELAHEAWTLFRGGSSSSVNRIWRIATQHPMPTAIIGVGLGWMVYESTGANERDTSARHSTRSSQDEPWSSERELPTALESARRRAAGTAGKATAVAGSAIDKAGDLADNVGEMAADLAGSARRAAGTAGDAVSDLGGQAREGMRRANVGFWDTLEHQPLVVGVATLAAGLLAGLLLPSTPREDELMGKTRDSLINEVKAFGHDALKKGQQIASAAADTLKQGADAQGLSADAVVEKVRAVGRDVVETVKAEMPEATSDEGRPARQESPQPPRHRAA